MKKFLFTAASFLASFAIQAQSSNEFLLISPPDAYKIVTNSDKGNLKISEYIPKSESLPKWTEMLSAHTFQTTQWTPKKFQELMNETLRKVCPTTQNSPVFESIENGYATATWSQVCEMNNGTTSIEKTWFKAIKGESSFFLVQKAFRFTPTEEQLQPWLDYLKNATVCDIRSSKNPCPIEIAPTTKTGGMKIFPILGELFAHRIPAGFIYQTEQNLGNYYLRSYILENDQPNSWTQRLLLTSSKGSKAQELPSAKSMAYNVAGSFQRACPGTYSDKFILEGKTPTGDDMAFILTSCGSHTLTTSKLATSETALIASIRGKLNSYTIQWSERGVPQDKALVPNLALWTERLTRMGPILICEQKENEAPPYPSCTAK